MRRHLSNRKATITTSVKPSKEGFEFNATIGKMVRKNRGVEVAVNSQTRSNWGTMSGIHR